MPTILFSIYEKTGLENIAREFAGWDWDFLASAGTTKYLKEQGFAARDVADLVGGGPILGHRVVTLSREVHAGLLAQDTEADRAELQSLGIPFIDAVYVTLYPLVEELRKKDATIESVTEKTDIGGPAMLRSAAKGRRLVASRPQEMESILGALRATNGKPMFAEDRRREFAHMAERTVAAYGLASAFALTQNPHLRAWYATVYGTMADPPLQVLCEI